MRDAAIIETLLDTDFYKLTMCRFALALEREEGRSTVVRYALRCRTKDARLADVIDLDELREQLEAVRSLRFHDDEIVYLERLEGRPFDPEFISWLRASSLPAISVSSIDGGLHIETEGTWPQAINWETSALAVVNELYARATARAQCLKTADLWSEGDWRLEAKIARLKGSGVRIIEFGTRRRFSRDWQEHVLNVMTAKLPAEIVGTSNIGLAKRYGLPPVGTMAHELFMVRASSADDDAGLRASQGRVLDRWWHEFGEPLSIALSDTFGSDAFFGDFSGERAIAWRGVRHDSGDPVVFGERVIRFYADQGIDPTTKTIVFSDGLDVEAILKLHGRFDGRIKTSFGWGTDLTNDVGLPTLSLVMKVVEASGRPTVKLSDDVGKRSGPQDEIARYARVFR